MASITKHKTGYRVQISVKGIRESAVFNTQAEAKAWANEREFSIRNTVAKGINTEKTVRDAFDRYLKEVSAHKIGNRWETIRLNYIATHIINKREFGQMRLCDVTTETLGHWRDMRLESVKGSSVNRELNILSHVFATAMKEWRWINSNPIASLRRPKDPEARDRRISDDEIERLLIALGYGEDDGEIVGSKSERVAIAFLFAIETGMRSGEIVSLQWGNVFKNHAHLPRTKNGTKRDVPLSETAKSLLRR